MKNRIFDWARALAGAALLTFVLKTVAFATYYIPSESMVPTLEVGDRLIATKFDYGYGPYSAPLLSLPAFPSKDGRLFGSLPARGDIVALPPPADRRDADQARHRAARRPHPDRPRPPHHQRRGDAAPRGEDLFLQAV